MSLAEFFRSRLLSLINPGSRLVVGVSGGADSLALLHLLHTLPAASAMHLHAATFDHNLRGEASAADVRFVVDTCETWGIPVTAGRLNAKSLLKTTGVENAARIARYDFLAEVAHKTGAQHVAVGHHADDQAETVLMHILRGSGLQGLSGMASSAPLPGHADLTLIRPLLNVSRREIETYCHEQGLQPRQDHTNLQTHLLRNRIRLETLPYLRQINPQVDHALNRLAAAAALDQDYIHQQVLLAIAAHMQTGPQRIALSREIFQTLHPALQHRFVLWAAGELGGGDAAYEHIASAVNLALNGQTGQQALLPESVRLRLDYGRVVIEQAGAPPEYDGPLLAIDSVLRVSVPGITPLPGGNWQLQAEPQPFQESGESQVWLMIAPQQRVELRTRRPGDRFAPSGLGGHRQKIKKWMIDHKVPYIIRDHVPLLVVEGEIATFYVAGRWISSHFFAGSDAQTSGVYFQFARHLNT